MREAHRGVLSDSLAVNWGSSPPSPAQSSLPVSGAGYDFPLCAFSKTLQIQDLTHTG